MFLDSFINKIDNYSDIDDLNISNDFTKGNSNKYCNDSETKPNSSDSPSEKEEDPDNNEEKKKNLIKIEKSENFAQFFLLAKGHNLGFCKEKKDTKIGKIIEKYIENMDEKEEIKNNFYYRDQLIDNNKTIGELNIEKLGFIFSK